MLLQTLFDTTYRGRLCPRIERRATYWKEGKVHGHLLDRPLVELVYRLAEQRTLFAGLYAVNLGREDA
jgi:hypothetical protein